MPQFKSHLIGGLILYVLVLFLFSLGSFSFATHLYWLSATLAGSLFPDIDIRSKGQHLFLKILALLLIVCLFLQAYVPVIMILFFMLIPLVMPHRGLFHDIWFITILCAFIDLLLIFFIPDRAKSIITTSLFFLLGVVSHLLLDKGFKGTFK